MIVNFFQSLEAHEVAYLLISGQATVLYGAATFSEDIDLWIEPSPRNVQRLRAALKQVGARYHKLTPPLDSRYFEAGHGFHFVFEPEPVFLDLLGRPPRSRSFAQAERDSRRFETDWGKLPVIGARDLIELKKTQRLADYPIISALTLGVVEASDGSAETLQWAVANLFTAESFLFFNEHYPQWVQSAPSDIPPALTRLAGRPADEIPDSVIEETSRWMNAAITRHQRTDRQYWRPIIEELRKLRRDRILMHEGTLV
jgi:hypothetical protein